MKYTILILILFFSVNLYAKPSYKLKIENQNDYTKYVLIKYKDKHNHFVEKEKILRKYRSFRIKTYKKTVYLFSLSFHDGGKTKYQVIGDDGVGFMKEHLMGRQANYRKFVCENKKMLIRI
jgi:hypothetical protein